MTRARWALAPWLLLGAMCAGLGIMIAIAVNDPGFAVAPEYYQHALSWDAERTRRAQSRALGWSVDWDFTVEKGATPDTRGRLRPIKLRLLDSHGAPLSGASAELVAFHNARAAARQSLRLREAQPGVYTTELEFTRPGLWELKVSASIGADSFEQASLVELTTERGRLVSGADPGAAQVAGTPAE